MRTRQEIVGGGDSFLAATPLCCYFDDKMTWGEGHAKMRVRRCFFIFLAAVLVALISAPAQACILSVGPSASTPQGFTLFPNWVRAETVLFDLEFCSQSACPTTDQGDIRGVTIFNYGTANETTDITGLSFCHLVQGWYMYRTDPHPHLCG